MANRNFPAKNLLSMHVGPVGIDGQIAIGASGAPTAPTLQTAPGVKAVTRLAAGIYVIQLQDNYAKLLKASISFASPKSGSSITAGSFVTGTAYQITALGSTNFAAIGVPADVTPAVGVIFVATGAGSGTGTAQALVPSGIQAVEVMGVLENSNNPVNNAGARIYIQCLAATSSSVTTLIPADPANGSIMNFHFFLNNSSVQ